MTLNQNLAQEKLILLNILKYNIVSISHVICHVTILLKIVNYWPVGSLNFIRLLRVIITPSDEFQANQLVAGLRKEIREKFFSNSY